MAEAKWMKGHKEKMELEEKKQKLLKELEPLRKEHFELSATLTDLRKCIVVDKGDYKLIEAERLNIIEELDYKVISLRLEFEEKQNAVKGLVNENNGLQTSIQNGEKELEKQKLIKTELQNEITKYSASLDDIKLALEKVKDEKRILISQLSEEASEKRKELSQMRKEYEEKRFELLRETRLLSIKRSDLEIYEARMRKKYPNESFILK